MFAKNLTKPDLYKTLPLEDQGEIEGGLDDGFRFEPTHPTPMDSRHRIGVRGRTRDNEGSFIKVSTKHLSLLLTSALAIMLVALTSCGYDGESSEVVQVATSPPPTVAPTNQPSATTAPTPTETPYWAKQIMPGIAIEQYPPLNTRTDYELKNTQEWLNGEPTTIADIRNTGRVVMVDFWTYT